MKKIIVIGCPGSGKSTFAKKLSEIKNIPLYQLDTLWQNNDKTNNSKEEFYQKLDKILKKRCWIIDGNSPDTFEKRLEKCDTAFLLDIPLEECISGMNNHIESVQVKNLWGNNQIPKIFKNSIVDFSNEQMPYIYEKLIRSKKEIHIFKSRREINRYIEKLQEE